MKPAKTSAVLTIILILTAFTLAQETPSDPKEKAKLALTRTAKDMGWPAQVFTSSDAEYRGKTFGVNMYGQEAEVDGAFIAVVTEEQARSGLDVLEENGLRRTTFQGYDAIIMSEGEKICDAGGTVGFVLKWVRMIAVYIGQILETNVNENDICLESHGTVAWTCGEYLFIVSSPDEDDNSIHIAQTLFKHADELKLCEPQLNVSGVVTDGHNHPMPYMKVTATFDGKDYTGFTDEDGKYAINIPKIYPNEKDPPELKVTFTYHYERDGKNYFRVIERGDRNPLDLEMKFKVKKDADLVKNMDFDANLKGVAANTLTFTKDDVEYKGSSHLTNYYHTAPIYRHTAEAVDFTIVILQADVDYKLPVDVLIFGDDGTWYSRSSATIGIDLKDSAYGSTNRPKNREYHEFAHHLMFSQWKGETIRIANDTNHGGYINSNTADSYTEGFAEFMAMVISDYSNDPELQPPEIYASFGSLENNLKAWGWRGNAEELAVAGILWDFYDKNADDGDTVEIPIRSMWKILKVKRPTFYDYYLEFKKEYPQHSASIDQIMINHGFFADKNEGNKKRDPVEPYFDNNPKNSRYDVGEYFVDYGLVGNVTRMEYDKGEEIGKATNYQRPKRTMAQYIPDAFIKVGDTPVRLYTVSVHYNNPWKGKDYSYTTEVREGLLYLHPLPEDVDATITVTPKSQDYSGQSYTIKTEQYLQKYYSTPQGTGYMDVHDFKLTPTGKQADPPYLLPNNAEPSWNVEAGYDMPDPMQKGCCCIPALPLLLAGLAAGLIGVKI
ncbi:MAG TPA: carboxypeptidase regulatory-like domain-containing protein [Candidatus Altiarchaeales archaeon]|nr:carboxypeptidase regulatory-like domain-containing protein [Candidatus Altiarchaeales archaeon]